MRRPLSLRLALASLAALLALGACSSSSTQVVGPDPPRCQVGATASPQRFGTAGGSGRVSVTIDPDCTWSATSGAGWITLTGTSTGQGAGSFPFSVAANFGQQSRSGGISVNGQTLTIAQDGVPCTFAVAPTALTFSRNGGNATITVTTTGACAWTATSQASWISISGSASGTGSGSVKIAVAVNRGGQRSGTVTVAGDTVTVQQQAARFR